MNKKEVREVMREINPNVTNTNFFKKDTQKSNAHKKLLSLEQKNISEKVSRNNLMDKSRNKQILKVNNQKTKSDMNKHKIGTSLDMF